MIARLALSVALAATEWTFVALAAGAGAITVLEHRPIDGLIAGAAVVVAALLRGITLRRARVWHVEILYGRCLSVPAAGNRNGGEA